MSWISTHVIPRQDCPAEVEFCNIMEAQNWMAEGYVGQILMPYKKEDKVEGLRDERRKLWAFHTNKNLMLNIGQLKRELVLKQMPLWR